MECLGALWVVNRSMGSLGVSFGEAVERLIRARADLLDLSEEGILE